MTKEKTSQENTNVKKRTPSKQIFDNKAFWIDLGWKLFITLITLLIVIILGFILIKIMPGNPVDTYAQKLASEQGITMEEARRKAAMILNYDPDATLLNQLGTYLGGLFKGDLGTSIYRDDVTVGKVIATFLPKTLFIASMSLAISFTAGILMGTRMAYKRKGFYNAASSSFIVVSGAIPDYLWGMILLFVFSVMFKIFPTQGYYSLILEAKGWPKTINFLYHAFLPILSLSIVQIGTWAFTTRGSAIGVLGEDYINAAKARGLPDRIIRKKYLRKNAMLPLVTTLGLAFAGLFGGSPLIENIFGYPGIGNEFNAFIYNRDYFVIQGLIVYMSAMVIIINLIIDLVYVVVDPRIRRGT